MSFGEDSLGLAAQTGQDVEITQQVTNCFKIVKNEMIATTFQGECFTFLPVFDHKVRR